MKNPSWVLQGPPYLNGSLHVGHAVNVIIKDFCLRYQKDILNQDASWVYNFDCQGLPVQRQIQKLNMKGNFLDNCLNFTKKTLIDAQEVLNELNLLHPVNSENVLLTTNLKYKTQLMKDMRKLFDGNFLQRESKHISYCYRCDTSLANAQIQQKELNCKVYLFKAKILNGKYSGKHLLFPTTEPQTCFSNLYLALNPHHTYYLRNDMIDGSSSQGEIIDLNLLVGCKYTIGNCSQGEVITSDKVHSNQIEPNGSVLSNYACLSVSPWGSITDYQIALTIKPNLKDQIESKKDLVLRQRVSLYKDMPWDQLPLIDSFQMKKKYDCCWRCNNKIGLAYTEQWYLKIPQEYRRKLSLLNQIPSNNPNLQKQATKFFSRAVDWCVSRNRTYGTPFPLTRCNTPNCDESIHPVDFEETDFLNQRECFHPSLNEVLKRKSQKDYSLICNTCGKVRDTIPFCLDVWIDSGYLSVYHNLVYPTFIQGCDQIRGWFYSSSVLKLLLHEVMPFQNLVYLGWIVNKGRKISKSDNKLGSLKETLSKTNVLNLRSYALSKASSQNTEFSIQVVDLQRKYVNVISNVYKFLTNPLFEDVELSQNVLDLLNSNEYYKERLDQLNSFTNTLNRYFESLNYSSYWNELKNHILIEYSRNLINNLKTNLTPQNKAFLKYYGKVLLKYVKPVLGLDFKEL